MMQKILGKILYRSIFSAHLWFSYELGAAKEKTIYAHINPSLRSFEFSDIMKLNLKDLALLNIGLHIEFQHDENKGSLPLTNPITTPAWCQMKILRPFIRTKRSGNKLDGGNAV